MNDNDITNDWQDTFANLVFAHGHAKVIQDIESVSEETLMHIQFLIRCELERRDPGFQEWLDTLDKQALSYDL